MPSSPHIEKIFEKYKNKMYRLALSVSRNEKDAEDIIQIPVVKLKIPIFGQVFIEHAMFRAHFRFCFLFH